MNGGNIVLRGAGLTVEKLEKIAYEKASVEVSPAAVKAMNKSYKTVLKIIEKDEPVYGVNTGFGKFSEVRITREELNTLQVNLVRSHACGVGSPLPEDVVKMILVMKANSLAKGFSGCRPVVVQTLVDMVNRGVVPVVPAHGSVGASGDLAPLAHIALVIIGEGEAFYLGKRMRGALALKKAGITPLTLGPKEGLSILNGTQVSTGLAVAAWIRLERLTRAADLACAWTLHGVAGLTSAYDGRIHDVRGHKGASFSAARIRKALKSSQILKSPESKRRVQDPYSLRCAPQVHGAVWDIVHATKNVLETEMNGVTDNPIVFADTDDVVSGGNFHAEPIAFVSDQLAIAGSELASISERRTYLLTDPVSSGLPAFLVEKGGLNSGFMIHQVTQAALVSANKTLAHPASVDSIPTSAGKEDHVSMATWAGFKAFEIMDRATDVLAIEILAAAQAVDMRKPLKPSRMIGLLQEALRKIVPPMREDRVAEPDIRAARSFILETAW